MQKVIAIGECVLDVVFSHGQPVSSYMGGRIANAAAALAEAGVPVTMVGECGDDRVGDIITSRLVEAGVDIQSVDRYSAGTTPFSAIFRDETEQMVSYGSYPPDRLDVLWPRINANDIVIFGSLYAIETPQRQRLSEILQYASTRKAIMVYLPGFRHTLNYSITKVMPNILENFEMADIVLACDGDLQKIFPRETDAQAFANHMIYCHACLHNAGGSTSVYTPGGTARLSGTATGDTASLAWQAGYVAGAVYALATMDITRDTLASADVALWQSVARSAHSFATRRSAEQSEQSD